MFGNINNNSYFCSRNGKDPLLQKKRYAPNLRYENVRIFPSKPIVKVEQNDFHV